MGENHECDVREAEGSTRADASVGERLGTKGSWERMEAVAQGEVKVITVRRESTQLWVGMGLIGLHQMHQHLATLSRQF